jgi:hypothetical protein
VAVTYHLGVLTLVPEASDCTARDERWAGELRC